jgi:general transcription factor 3C polypeptide 3 (transcription factor C subunit 4)
MQGFTFLFRYHELAEASCDANFNLARAFHQVGLTHLATPYYEKVLEQSEVRSFFQYQLLIAPE